MKSTQRLWRWLGLICVLSFGALGYLGWQIYLAAPPIPKAVVTTDGELLFSGEQIQRGQGLWYARSPEVIHSALMEALVWLRVPGDIVFAAGSGLLAVYAWKLLRPARPALLPLGAARAGAKH